VNRMPWLALLNSKGGYAAIGLVLLGLMYGYFTVKIMGMNTLHDIEISKLTSEIESNKAEVEKQKNIAQLNGKRNEVCQTDFQIVMGKLDDQAAEIKRLKDAQQKKISEAEKAALARMHSPEEAKSIINNGKGPEGMNSFMDKVFGEGKI